MEVLHPRCAGLDVGVLVEVSEERLVPSDKLVVSGPPMAIEFAAGMVMGSGQGVSDKRMTPSVVSTHP